MATRGVEKFRAPPYGREGWPPSAKTRASSFGALGAWATRARLRPSGTRSRRTVGSGVYTRTQNAGRALHEYRLPVCYHLRQARQTTLGESGVAKLAECNLGAIKVQCTVLIYFIYIYIVAPVVRTHWEIRRGLQSARK